jgi:hypothetical protein
MQQRNLTEHDVKAIVDLLRKEVTQAFYQDLGKGIWSIAWKAVTAIILGIAAYGHFKGFK